MICSLTKTKSVICPAKTRLRVLRDEKLGIDVPTVCQHCNDPPCMDVCPTNAITKDVDTGIVTINEEKCKGCKECILICPFEAVFFDPDRRVAMICDLCGGEPTCVRICPPDAIKCVRADSINEKTRRRDTKKIQELVEVRRMFTRYTFPEG